MLSPIGKSAHATHSTMVAKWSIDHADRVVAWRPNHEYPPPIRAEALMFLPDLADDEPKPALHLLSNAFGRLDSVRCVLDFQGYRYGLELLAQYKAHSVHDKQMPQNAPNRHCFFAIDDRYKWHEYFAGTIKTLDAGATWNPCHHYIQLKKKSVQEKRLFGLSSQT